MSKASVFDPATDPFFCTQLLFVPPEPNQPYKPEDISLWKTGTVLRVRFLDGAQHDKVSKVF